MLDTAEAFIFGRCRDAVSNLSTNDVNDFLCRQLPSRDLSTPNSCLQRFAKQSAQANGVGHTFHRPKRNSWAADAGDQRCLAAIVITATCPPRPGTRRSANALSPASDSMLHQFPDPANLPNMLSDAWLSGLAESRVPGLRGQGGGLS